MGNAKERTRRELIRFINDLDDLSLVPYKLNTLLHKIDNFYFEEYIGGDTNGKEVDSSKSKKDLKRRDSSGKEVNVKAEKVLWCKSIEI